MKITNELYREIADKIMQVTDGESAFCHTIDGDGWYFEGNIYLHYEKGTDRISHVVTYWNEFGCFNEFGNPISTDFKMKELESYLLC